jgi:hypothetical protein
MANRSKLTVKSVSEALKINAGVIAYAARALNTDRRHVYAFIRKHPELEQVREEARETLLDTAEHNVISAVDNGCLKTSRWVLDRLGRTRGYTTRQEIAGAPDAPLQYQRIERVIIDPDPWPEDPEPLQPLAAGPAPEPVPGDDPEDNTPEY